jgi:predicted DNA-binding protein (MmcQ/YjbR family)
MDRGELEAYLFEQFGLKGERLFAKHPTFAVYRHEENRKWFCVLMEIDRTKLGLRNEGKVQVVNFKCHSDMADFLWQQTGIFTAYHMNKKHWITVLLDGSVEKNTVLQLLGVSFSLTNKKAR